MKKAVITIVSEYNIGSSVILMNSAKVSMPGWDRIVFILDSEENKVKELDCSIIKDISFRTADSLFGDDFKDCAFYFEEVAFIELVKLKAIKTLLNEYGSILVSESNAIFCNSPVLAEEYSSQNNTIIEIVKHFSRNNNNASNSINNITISDSFVLPNNFKQNAELFLITHGLITKSFINWCISKFDYLFRDFLVSADDKNKTVKQVNEQVDFIYTWLKYSSIYDLNYYIIPMIITSITTRENDSKEVSTPRLLLFKENNKPIKNEINKLPNEQIVELVNNYDKKINDFNKVLDLRNYYKYDFFSDGTPINYLLREYYIENYRLRDNCKYNPFDKRELFTNASVITGDEYDVPLTAIIECIWKTRSDLQNIFPKYKDEDRINLVNWFLLNSQNEYSLSSEYIIFLAKKYSEYKSKNSEHELLSKKILSKLHLDKKLNFFSKNNDVIFKNSAKENTFGVNLSGFIRGDFGLGEATRILARTFESGNIPFTIINYTSHRIQMYKNREWENKISNRFEYGINVILININGIHHYFDSVSKDALKKHYNIGYLYWEMPELPDEWAKESELFDEIWVASEFVAESFRKKTTKPIYTIPCCITADCDKKMDRHYFGLPEAKFLFLMMYDSRSSNQRKNPLAAVNAFIKSFGNRDDVNLVVKVNMPSGWNLDDEIFEIINGYKNIIIINETLPKIEVNSLINCCDVFVSLHRSEGFGLGPAEAMYLRKPVVITNWSGNLQYMTRDNCCPVEYEIVELEESYGPYIKGYHWAEPNIDNASMYMNKLVDDVEYYNYISDNAEKTIKENFSPEVIGKLALTRLKQIYSKQ